MWQWRRQRSWPITGKQVLSCRKQNQLEKSNGCEQYTDTKLNALDYRNRGDAIFERLFTDAFHTQ
jgi:hypothetical protein